MSNGTIKSNTITAEAAISKLAGVDTSSYQNYQVDFSYTSGIAGMESARQTTNQMLTAISDFSAAVLIQADKFHEIAQKIEKRDIEEAGRWGN